MGPSARGGPAPARRRRPHRRHPCRPRHRSHQGGKGGEHTGPSPVDRGKAGSKMHVLSDANGLPLLVGVSAGNTHDSEGLKSMVAGHQTRHDPRRGRYFKPQRLHADKAYDRPDLRKWLRGKRSCPASWCKRPCSTRSGKPRAGHPVGTPLPHCARLTCGQHHGRPQVASMWRWPAHSGQLIAYTTWRDAIRQAHWSPDRPQRHRVQRTIVPSKVGDRTHDVLAVRLPQTQPPLRARSPQLPGLSRSRRSHVLLQATCPPHHVGHGLSRQL
ncbi:Transposase DDE domain-containing protein [Streptomyces sp. Ag109_G2-15]|nr:Transposase DDE domain-containing protein [Streptomyces sp. Ag109_G2-15]